MATQQITYENIDRRSRNAIMFGLMLAMLIACLDGTIVATCGPVIAQDLHGTGLYAWMVTAYMLSETLMIPLSGKLSDLYGRKPLFLVGLSIFVIGSVLAGSSNSMIMLIVCRGFQGLGGGILIPVAMAAIADLYPPAERPKMQGVLGAVFALGSCIGPLVGGYLAEYVSWRWAFYINIPLAIIALVLTLKKFPAPTLDSKPVIDIWGMSILTVMLLDIVLFLEFGGKEIPWIGIGSALMIALLIALGVAFVLVEKRSKEPVIAPHLLRNRPILMACLIMLIFGIAMMGTMTYSSMFAISVLGLSTLTAGAYSLALVGGMVITVNLSGKFLEKLGHRGWVILGIVFIFTGMMMMSRLSVGSSLTYYAVCLFVLGLGFGCMTSSVMVGVQNSSKNDEMGMSTSAVSLFRTIGCTMSTAIFSMIIASRIGGELKDNLPSEVYDIVHHDTSVLDDLVYARLNPLAEHSQAIIDHAYDILLSFSNSVNSAFIIGGIVALMVIVPAILFKPPLPSEIPAGGPSEEETDAAVPAAPDGDAEQSPAADAGETECGPSEEERHIKE